MIRIGPFIVDHRPLKDSVNKDKCDLHGDTVYVLGGKLHTALITRCTVAYAVKGRQSVSKFKETAKNTIHIYLVLLRLPQFQTDVVVSFNNPVNIR